jgi:predicted dinucleotide-binding enzyme
MRIGIIGAGRIGGNIARQLARAGHDVLLSYSREPERLAAQAAELGERARAVTPREAVAGAEVVVVAVPWGAIEDALAQAGPLDGKVVIDTTNPFGPGPRPSAGQTAAAFNAGRMPGGRYTKAFNTLTSAFQVEAAERTGEARVVQWLCGDDVEAKAVVAGLIEDAGYVPVDLGGTADCTVMEAPRRPGAVYGEEYRAQHAHAVVEAVRAGRPIPPTPDYGADG